MPALSDRLVRNTAPPKTGRRIITDTHRDAPRGFALRVNANGTRSFVLRYKVDGRDRLLSIGEWPTWSLAAARKQASDYRREIDGGRDILEQRREAQAEPTVADAVERFLATKQSLRSYRDIAATLCNHLNPALGQRRIRKVRKHEIIEAVEAVAAEHGRTAAILLTYAKQLWAWADDRGMVDVDVAAGIKPSRVAATMRPQKRSRLLSHAEIQTLWNMQHPPAGMSADTLRALKMILLTGQRPGEVAGMRFDEIRGKTWVIPAGRRKVDATHLVPLTDSALALIEQAGSGEYVFEPRPGRPLSAAALAKAVLRSAEAFAMEGERWRPHDLRRTCRTGLAALGVADHIAELVIGHTRKGIQATYDHHRYEVEKRVALEAWERRLLAIAAGENTDGDNVVSITEGRP